MKLLDLSRTQSSIVFLHSLEPRDAIRFGAKTAGLVSAISSGASVLPGLALSVDLVSQIASEDDVGLHRKIVEDGLLELAQSYPASSFIVRSSSVFENDERCDFSGVFETYAGVRTAEEVLLAISDIVSAAREPKLSPFFEECGVSIDCDHMGILIQPEANPAYGGVIELKDNAAMIEFTSKSIAAAISGDLQYSSVLWRNGKLESKHFEEWDRDIALDELRNLNFQENTFWRDASRNRALVEFFVERSRLYVAQIKDRRSDLLSDLEGSNELVPYSAPASAGKFAAMRFFSENGLFDKPLYTLERGWSVEAALNYAGLLFNNCEHITLRVADGVEIGLPRAFCSSVDEVRSFVQTHSQNSYDLIMHGYINVERSLEILVDQDGFVIEHIPGMWESPNAHQPDVLLAKNGVITQYRINGTREAVIEGKTLPNSDLSQPLAAPDFERLIAFASKVWASFDASYRSDFPLNIHAVCDGRFDEFQCLNIRPGFKQEDYLLPVDDVRLVTGLADLKDWEPEQTVRLSLSLSRGDEGSLIPLGRALLKAKRPVIIDFGILSHPAMILRRIGCKLVPSYKVAGCLAPDSYTIERQHLDTGLDPINRILGENSVMPNDDYHIVPDRDQITDRHWIGLSRLPSDSWVDSGKMDQVLKIYEAFADGDDAFFFEKGRSSFCTSIFTSAREHFHLIKGQDFKHIVEQLARQTDGCRYLSLDMAYRAAPSQGAYVLFGTPSHGFWLASGRNSYEKGLLRSAFSATEKHIRGL